jgi:hypothetical protein
MRPPADRPGNTVKLCYRRERVAESHAGRWGVRQFPERPYFLFSLRLTVASLRESNELSVFFPLDEPW